MHSRLVRSIFWAIALSGVTVLAGPSVAGASTSTAVIANGATQPMTTPPPPNTVTYTCPHQTKGAFCEVNWTDGHGFVTATFVWWQNGMRQVQSFQLFCNGSTCKVEGEGQDPSISPRKWTVTGHSVALVADTDGDVV
jgi:hypothetical protein